MGNRKQSFPALECSGAEVLILGAMPSDKSIELGEYYGNPHNRFWRVMAAFLDVELPLTYEGKIQMLSRGKMALWDVVNTAQRKGSLDSNIIDVVPNDIAGLLEKYPSIHTILFNGKKSEQLFNRYFAKDPARCYQTMPSTSPANAAISFERLCCEWGDMFEGDAELIRDGENFFVKDIPDICPVCCNGNVVKVLYGEPTPEAWRDHLNGKLMIGGCCVFEDSPTHQCAVCGSGFSKEKRGKKFKIYQYYNGERQNPFNREEQLFNNRCWEAERQFEKLYIKGDLRAELFDIMEPYRVAEWEDILKRGSNLEREPLYKIWLFNLLDNYSRCLFSEDSFPYTLEQFSKDIIKPNFDPKDSKYKSEKSYTKYLLSKCRIYSGDEDGLNSLGWYEQAWVKQKLENEAQILNHIIFYKKCGFEHFREYDGVPMSLKGLLLNRYLHWSGPGDSIEGFKEWYVDAYINREYE